MFEKETLCMLKETKETAKTRMQKGLQAFKSELMKIRTGRAHPSLLDHIKVSYYGSDMPLSQVASVAVADPRTLAITPWDKSMVQPIEKAIIQSDLGLNPATAGTVIRVPLPPLTEERRRELTKIVHQAAESARIEIRNIRRDANSEMKELLKEKMIGEDEEHHAEVEIQKLTDQHIAEVDKSAEMKEKELMEV